MTLNTSVRDRRVPYVVLALGVVLTAAAATFAHGAIKAQAAKQAGNFTHLAGTLDRMTGHLYSRMQRVDEVLRAGAVLATQASSLRSLRLANWASVHDTTADFRGLGPIEFSSKNQQALAEELVGAGVPGSTFRSDMKGAADSTYLVSASSARAGSPKRLYAALAPARSGDARSIPVGFVYMSFDVEALMLSELARAPHPGVRLRLYYSVDTAVANLAFDSDHDSAGPPFKSTYVEHHTIYMFGSPWALTVDASSESGMADTINPVPTVIVAGAILTLLLFAAAKTRARAKESARDTEVRYDALFNGTPIPMWVFDGDTQMIFAVNDAAVARYGYTRSEFLALHMRDLRPASEAAAAEAYLKQLPANYQHGRTRIHCKKDGTAFEVETNAHTIDFAGRRSVVVAANDISDRLRAEAAVSASEERLRQMAEHIKESFFVVDLHTSTALYVSPTWSEIWGRPIAEGYDPKIWIAAVHPDDRAALTASQLTVANGGTADDNYRVIRPDSTVRWVRSRSFPVRNADGDIYRMVGVVEDITELRQIEARFAQAQKMEAIGQLAGGVAHDFNNLLTVILGEAEQLKGIVPPGMGCEHSVNEIEQAGLRAAALTRQLLAFSRSQPVVPTVFDLNDTVADMSNMCRRLIGENIALVTRLAPNAWMAQADVGQVEQVLANLVVNARDAMPTGGRLTIETANATLDVATTSLMAEIQPGEYVEMTVSDTGTGMTAEVKARIFEPFFTTKEPGKGTGLGLATCYGIVKQAGGHLTVYSELGIGTTIKVFLPRGNASPSTIEAVKPAAALPRGHETILVVEDEAAVRRVILRLLSAQGYVVLQAQDGVEAAAIMSTHPGSIDLLLTDVVLPGIGGREIADQALACRPGIKVLFASGYNDDMILQHRLLEKDVALLQKPFTRESIARKVRDVLDAPLSAPADQRFASVR